MAVKIRLKKMGKSKQPYYRVIVADIRSPRDGRFIEAIGLYHPRAKADSDRFKINKEKLEKWIKQGAQPTATVKQLIKTLNK